MKKYTSKLTNLQLTMIVVFALLLVANLSIRLAGTGITRVGGGDDAAFFGYLQHSSLTAFLKQRYMTWSSRVVIETVLSVITHFSILWKLLNAVMMFIVILIPYKFILETENESRNIQTFLFSASLFFLLPMEMFYETGWMATTTNYLWILAAGEVALIPTLMKLKNIDGPINKWVYGLSAFALVYAANQEQMVVILLLLFIGAMGIMLFQHRSVKWEILQLFITISSFIIIILAPGNKVRKVQEIQHWLPQFGKLSLVRKVELGYSSTLSHFFFNFDLLTILLLVMILVVFWKKSADYKATISNVSLVLPLLLVLVVVVDQGFMKGIYPGVDRLKDFMTLYGSKLVFSQPKSWIPDLVLLALAASVVGGLFRTKQLSKSLIMTYILFCGVISRIIMGFSPTIWASGTRTFLFLYESIICVALFIYASIGSGNTKRYVEVMAYSLGILGYILFVFVI